MTDINTLFEKRPTTIEGGTVDWASVTGKPTFGAVATSNDYNDLDNKPTTTNIAILSVTTTFTIPALSASQTQEFDNVSWVTIGMPVFLSDGTNYGTFEATNIATNTLTLKNTWGKTTGTTIAIGAKLSPAGYPGDVGTTGVDGADGTAATIAIGTVTTGAAGSSVSVTNVGTSTAAVFDITIPKGDTGATGSDVYTDTTTKTSNYTAVTGDRIPCDTSGGAFTITTPASGIFQVIDIVGNTPTTGFGASSKALTISAASGTVMGSATLVLNVGGLSPKFKLYGTDWRIINHG